MSTLNPITAFLPQPGRNVQTFVLQLSEVDYRDASGLIAQMASHFGSPMVVRKKSDQKVEIRMDVPTELASEFRQCFVDGGCAHWLSN